MCRLLPGLPHPFFFFHFCALLLIPLIPTAFSDPLQQYCPFTASYASNSTSQSLLNALLFSLSSAGPITGFLNSTRGAGADRVYGLSLCRGDVDADRCQTCLNNATRDIISRCQHRKTAAVWYDECLLRYSERNFFSSVDTSYSLRIPNPNDASQPDRFNRSLANLMDELVTTAAYRRPGRMFAAGDVGLNGSRRLYGLVQCTRDLSSQQCSDCLRGFISFIPTCCGGKEGARLFGFNCLLRFELFQFFEESSAVGMPESPLPPPMAPRDASTPEPLDLGPTASLPLPPAAAEKKKGTVRVVLLIVLPVLAASVVAISSYVWMKRRKATANVVCGGEEDNGIPHDESMSFDLRALRAATSNFSYENKLGEGGFGAVYKGVLQNGQQIAVKKLSRSSPQGLIQLKNEMVLIAKLQHRNLVRLLGYCVEENANLLVYEYLPNKSLDKLIFDPVRGRQLNWERRYKIIEGIARGLLYLHEDSRHRVIHRDLKTSNILLDAEMNPKISDFGLAKLFGIEQSQGNTSRIVGTHGYMAPEYVTHGHYSKKSDMYSFGIIILEIITGRQSNRFHGSGRTLAGYVWQHWVEETVIEVLDQSIQVTGYLMEQISRCIHIGLLCVQEDSHCRPSIKSVLLMLSSDVIALPIALEPAYYTVGGTSTSSHSSATDQGINSLYHECLNNEINSH